jgi:rhodanese-related sulfurtransferase
MPTFLRSLLDNRTCVRGPLLLAIAALIASSAAAAPSTPAVPTSIFDGMLRDRDPTPEINTSELQAALAKSTAIVLDARPYDEFAISHLPGARSVKGKAGTTPALYVADVNDVLRRVPDKQKELILYCNGMYCGRSKRFGAELTQAGYVHVRRYQLGIPAWRALGGVTQVEKEALVTLLARDKTAVLVDGRDPGSRDTRLNGAVMIPLSETTQAKNDGRLPMTDHNTRIFVVGASGAQARAVAEAIVKDAFHNVSFYDGSVAALPTLIAKHK